jgi:hypothetical protein
MKLKRENLVKRAQERGWSFLGLRSRLRQRLELRSNAKPAPADTTEKVSHGMEQTPG